MSKIQSLLGNTFKYLILFVKKDSNNIGYSKSMVEFEWISLQTRTLEDNHNIPNHSYKPKRIKSLDQKINIEARNEEKSTYNTEKFPLTVTILHTKKDNPHQYQSSGTITSALETFQTIVNFK
jgi:hypothetical protein